MNTKSIPNDNRIKLDDNLNLSFSKNTHQYNSNQTITP